MINNLQKNVYLAPYTTFQIGGPADYFCVAKTRNDFIGLLEWALDRALPVTIIGGGSNLLISDSGVRGLVILNKTNRYHFSRKKLTTESGTILAKLARESIKKGYSGLDFGANIPGTIGGAIIGNAGAEGKSASAILVDVTLWARDQGIIHCQNKDLAFSYRHSILKNDARKVLIEATFQLKVGDKEQMLAQIQQDLIKRRSNYRGLSCGSYFVNPENVEITLNNKIIKMPSAGLLIEASGLKNYAIGGAQVSDRHANVIVNNGGAKAADVLIIERQIIERINDKFNIILVPEVVKVGEF